MSAAFEARPLLPQTESMQTFSFAPPNMGIGADKKNYVFVDEHNRHKRLKVMRACEGCRKRKIKCDAATTNHWPCASCVRLKQICIPPTLNYDRVHGGGGHASGLERVLDFDNSDGSGDDEYSTFATGPHVFELQNPQEHMQMSQIPYSTGLQQFSTPPYSDKAFSQPEFGYDDVPSIQHHIQNPSYRDNSSFDPPQSASLLPLNGAIWNSDQYTTTELSDVLGELKIHENGVAPYISQQKKSLAEAPAFEEFEVKLPTTTSGSGSTVRIPPELMPSEEQCMEWFEIFFSEIHPYVPVISKPYFYQQWRSNRRSISPLILEAIFACAGRMSDDPAQGAQWLALAAKHEDCFMDVPRLSTIQALLLLLKARESVPKRGYYYRSWMTVKKLVTMAHDLELHEHYSEHKAGRGCESDPTECLIRTRIWQNIFVCEIMIGGPQGRTDMGVVPETVDLEVQRPLPGIDSSDFKISRQFTYFVRKVRSVRAMHDIKTSAKAGEKMDFVADPKFVALSSTLTQWLDGLPTDLQVEFPDDETPPWLPSHFIGNMHSYYHLTVIMLHRPQLMHSSSYANGNWKMHMAVCYASAKAMCRLQEGVLQTFGLSGLLCMQRGINFVIYAVLTCTMIHLVAITSPDPAFNSDAKDYFTRHMRILENCTSAWPMPEMQTQIDALREAFSADTSRPFELKRSFPFGSPSSNGLQPSPPLDPGHPPPMLTRDESYGQVPQTLYHAQPITPPVSAGFEMPKDTPFPPASMAMVANGQHQSMPALTPSMGDSQVDWNPTPIFNQWNTAFGGASAPMPSVSSSIPQQSPPLYTPSSMTSQTTPSLQNSVHQQQQSYPLTSTVPSLSRQQTAPQLPAYTAHMPPTPSFVTSSMWRDTVASTYDPGVLKRRRNGGGDDSNFLLDNGQSKRRG